MKRRLKEKQWYNCTGIVFRRDAMDGGTHRASVARFIFLHLLVNTNEAASNEL